MNDHLPGTARSPQGTHLQDLARARLDEAVRQFTTYATLAGVTPAPYIAMGATEGEKMHAARVNALLARGNVIPHESGNPYADFDLPALARDAAGRAGFDAISNPITQVVAQAFTQSTSDFPELLKDVATKSLLRGYDEAGETFALWTVPGTLPDLKPAERVGTGTFPALDKVVENAEYLTASLNDRGETVQLGTYGKIWGLSRVAVVNNQLDHFVKVPRAMGRAAARTVGDAVYQVLTSNPLMADGVALFDAAHGNLTSPGGAPATATVDAMRASMAAQIDNGVRTGIRLRYLVVPIALEGTARVVANSQFFVGDGVDIAQPNSAFGTFDVIADHRLDATSAVAWYGVADPARFDTVELSYLNGQSTPYIEQQGRFTADGVMFKVRLDFGVKALDWRAVSKNAGA